MNRRKEQIRALEEQLSVAEAKTREAEERQAHRVRVLEQSLVNYQAERDALKVRLEAMHPILFDVEKSTALLRELQKLGETAGALLQPAQNGRRRVAGTKTPAKRPSASTGRPEGSAGKL